MHHFLSSYALLIIARTAHLRLRCHKFNSSAFRNNYLPLCVTISFACAIIYKTGANQKLEYRCNRNCNVQFDICTYTYANTGRDIYSGLNYYYYYLSADVGLAPDRSQQYWVEVDVVSMIVCANSIVRVEIFYSLFYEYILEIIQPIFNQLINSSFHNSNHLIYDSNHLIYDSNLQ